MPYQLHDVEVISGSSGLAKLDRLTIGLKANIPHASGVGEIVSGELQGDERGVYTSLPTLVQSGNPEASGGTFTYTMRVIANPFINSPPGTGYVPGDTVTFVGGTGTAPILTVSKTKLVTLALNDAGTNYAPTDVITLAGGVQTSPAAITVSTTKVITKAVLTAGSGYNINDTITVAGGVAATKAIFTVTHTKLVSLAQNAVGSGYAINDTITLAGGTAGTPAVLTVTGVSGGAITSFSITTAGDYTVQSTTFTQASTSGIGTGATFQTGLFGVLTLTVTNAGSYTTNATTFTQFATSGAGTGATFNTIVYGINTFTISSAGLFTTNAASFTQGGTAGLGTGATFNTAAYGVAETTISNAGSLSVLAASPVSTTSSGAGTGATFTPTYELATVTASGGAGYDSDSRGTFTGGGLVGDPAIEVYDVDSTGNGAQVLVEFGADVNLPEDGNYSVFVNAQQECFWFIPKVQKTSTGFTVALLPRSNTESVVAGSIDVMVIC